MLASPVSCIFFCVELCFDWNSSEKAYTYVHVYYEKT
jgi:hypothetical protein